MKLNYVVSERTDGANPFKIFEALPSLNESALEVAIRRLDYSDFLKTAYWFAVSHVAKARAGMRCQVCNGQTHIATHHRTYDNHGREHLHMIDLTVLCENCHGLFHGHREPVFPKPQAPRESIKLHRGFVMQHEPQALNMPDGETIVLTRELMNRCRANGSFTNATLNAFGLGRANIKAGWPERLIGRQLTRQQYAQALEGKFIYRQKLNP